MAGEKRHRLSTARALEQGDMTAVKKSLTKRQRRFCHEYVKDFNKNAAVLRAGYDTAYPQRQAANLFKNPGIVALIEELQTEKKYEMTDVVDPAYVVKGIVEITSNPEAKDSDKLRGYELLAKHLGMLTDKQEITGKDGGPLSVAREEIEQDAQQLIGFLTQLSERAKEDKKEDDESNVVPLKRA